MLGDVVKPKMVMVWRTNDDEDGMVCNSGLVHWFLVDGSMKDSDAICMMRLWWSGFGEVLVVFWLGLQNDNIKMMKMQDDVV